jgi:hypothetical protein
VKADMECSICKTPSEKLSRINGYDTGSCEACRLLLGAVFDRVGQVALNALLTEDYSPYCLRCSGAVRMRPVERFYWRCKCGAQHDERQACEVFLATRLAQKT